MGRPLVPEYVAAYVNGAMTRESADLRAVREETASHPMARMQISPDQGALLAFLCRLIGARRTLEVGTFTGYSALAVAEALPPGGQVVACDVSEEWTAIARRHFAAAGQADTISLRLGPAAETLDGLLAAGEEGRFDLAFIDADKQGYDGYYERCLRLVRPGGVIALDNMLWSGAVATESTDPDTLALRALSQKVLADTRVDASLLTVGDGLLLARRR